MPAGDLMEENQTESGFVTEDVSKTAPMVKDNMWWQLVLLSVLATVPSAYIVFLAAASPSPPVLQGFGPVLSVSHERSVLTNFVMQSTEFGLK